MTIQNTPGHLLSDSGFYRLPSPLALANLLRIDVAEIEQLTEGRDGNYRLRWIEPPGKSRRLIEEPRQHLMRVQRRINSLLSRIRAPKFLYSGVKGRSAVLNAKEHDLGVPLVKLDISRFYPSTDGSRVF